MNFIIVSLGIMIYTYTIIMEKVKEHKIDKEISEINFNHSKIYNDWHICVTDEEIEYRVKNEIIYDKPEVYKKLSPIVCSLNGFPDKFDNYIMFYAFMKRFPMMMERMYMGIYHKLLCKDASEGIRSPDVYDIYERESWDMHHEFMKWLNKQLTDACINWETKYVRGSYINSCKNNSSQIMSINQANNSSSGVYCWKPMIHRIPAF